MAAGRITLWGAGQLHNIVFGKLVEPPSEYWLALIKDVAPTPFVSGAELDEPVGGSYNRVRIQNDTDHFSNVGQLQVAVLETETQFLPCTEDWGTIRYWALCNAEVDGYVWYIGKMQSALKVDNGDIAYVAAGNLSFTLGPFFTSEDL